MPLVVYWAVSAVALLTALVVHEGAHALVARLFGRTYKFEFEWPRGFRVHHDGRDINAWQEAAITAAGPAANLAVWLLLGCAPPFEWNSCPAILGGVQFWMAVANLLIPSPIADGWQLVCKLARALGVKRP